MNNEVISCGLMACLDRDTVSADCPRSSGVIGFYGVVHFMLITIQFPIVDSRKFVSNDTQRLAQPSWLLPTPNKDFVRSFGLIRRRPLGGLTGWVGENCICEADHAIRFDNFKSFKDDLGKPIKFKVAFRRFYFDGLAVGKFEIGIAVWGFRKQKFWDFKNKALSTNKTKEFLFHILNLPVSVHTPYGSHKKHEKCSLRQAGKLLANLYAVSSTQTKALSTGQCFLKDWWIQACEPVVIVNYGFYDNLQIPFGGKFLTKIGDDGVLSHHVIPFGRDDLRMWLIEESYNSSDSNTLRQLRIFLLRLHAERACLKQILRNISTEKLKVLKRSKQADMLQEYLNQATKRIRKLDKHSNKRAEAEIGDLARKAEDNILPGECDALFNALRIIDVEKNILKKVEDFAQQSFIFKEQIMGDKYNVSGQAGAVGSNAHAHDMTFNQLGSQIEKSVDLMQLANELSKLRQAMMKESTEVEHSIAVGEIAKAEQAAQSKDSSKIAEHLKSAGKWALDIASKIGVPIAVEALKRSMEIRL